MSAPAPAKSVDANTLGALIRVLLSDDHSVTLWGLSQLIESASPRLTAVLLDRANVPAAPNLRDALAMRDCGSSLCWGRNFSLALVLHR